MPGRGTGPGRLRNQFSVIPNFVRRAIPQANRLRKKEKSPPKTGINPIKPTTAKPSIAPAIGEIDVLLKALAAICPATKIHDDPAEDLDDDRGEGQGDEDRDPDQDDAEERGENHQEREGGGGDQADQKDGADGAAQFGRGQGDVFREQAGDDHDQDRPDEAERRT